MKKNGISLAGLLAIMVALTSCQTKQEDKATVKVIRVMGEARYKDDRGDWKPITRGALLPIGVPIQTAPKSLVDICLNKGHFKHDDETSENAADSGVRIFENSALRLNKLIKRNSGSKLSEEIRMELLAGEIMGTIGTLHPGSSYEINISRGLVKVHGGTYMTSSDGVLNVIDGAATIEITMKDGTVLRKEVGRLESFDPATGEVVKITQNSEMPIRPFRCSDPIDPASSPPASGLPHGPGMGGALRKF